MAYTWQIVSNRMQQFGRLESVEMITPGTAKVWFADIKDAERAKAALQGTTVEGCALGIEYLLVQPPPLYDKKVSLSFWIIRFFSPQNKLDRGEN